MPSNGVIKFGGWFVRHPGVLIHGAHVDCVNSSMQLTEQLPLETNKQVSLTPGPPLLASCKVQLQQCGQDINLLSFVWKRFDADKQVCGFFISSSVTHLTDSNVIKNTTKGGSPQHTAQS